MKLMSILANIAIVGRFCCRARVVGKVVLSSFR